MIPWGLVIGVWSFRRESGELALSTRDYTNFRAARLLHFRDGDIAVNLATG